MNPLAFAARHGPAVLAGGLVAGFVLPLDAELLRPWLPLVVMLIFFLAVLRSDPRRLIGSAAELPGVLRAVLVFQLVMPLCIIAVVWSLDAAEHPVAMALILMCAGPSIVSSPNMCIMLGHDARPALRMMVVGTLLIPFSVVPIFWLMPALGDPTAILAASGRLLALLGLGGVAVVLRLTLLRNPSQGQYDAMDGLSAIGLAAFVIGLMPGYVDILWIDPVRAAGWFALAFVANIGVQIPVFLWARRHHDPARAVALGMIAGNRNVAIFLVSLPPQVIAPVLPFIACYQAPMYLTPILMRRFYRARNPNKESV